MSRKKQLLSIILCFCMTVASITVGTVDAEAAEYSHSNFTQIVENVKEPYYQYQDTANTVVESEFNGGDTI